VSAWTLVSGDNVKVYVDIRGGSPTFYENFRQTCCYEIQYTWTARSTETETETGLDRYVMLGARWLTEY